MFTLRYSGKKEKCTTLSHSLAAAAAAEAPAPARPVLFDPDSQVSCTICLGDYEEGEVLRVLPCLHRFHQPCVDPWLAEHTQCPLCKADVMAGVY